MSAPNCMKCRHFYLTYDYKKPYGCKAMGFKSATSPSRVVYVTSSIHCQLFEPKKQPPPPTKSTKKYI